MKTEEALKQYREMTYDLAKLVSRLYDIRERMGFINSQMEWDGMFETSFDDALKNLANVEAAAVTYCMEDEFRDMDIRRMRDQLNAYTENGNG